MKHTKKKRKQKPSISKSTQPIIGQNSNPNEINNESKVLNGVTEQFASFSIDKNDAELTASSSTRDNDSIEIFGSSSENRDDDSVEIFGSLTETCSSSSGSSGLSNFDGFNRGIGIVGKGSKWGRGNKVIAATGMVSGVIGKDYVPTVNKKRAVAKWRGLGDDVSHDDAEQFLCSMLSDDCEFGMDLVKDVLCQTAYDVERALDVLLELTSPSSELSENGQHENLDAKCKDTRSFIEASDTLTDRTSYLASSSDSDLNMGYNRRNYFEVLAGHVTDPPSAPRNTSELTQDVLESLFNTKKSSKHEPTNMNWRNVVKKMESFGQTLDYPSEDTAKKQLNHAKGDDYHTYRNSASQHWDSMKTYYHKAATAYASGNREYAAYLSDKGRMCNEKARKADDRASHDIFSSRNKDIENVITIDLHGQHVKQGMKLLKLHLLFGAYVRSVRLFRVITGCGSHGLGKSKLKQSVVNILETENIDWKEENKGTLLIKLNGQREFSFLDSGSDID